MNVGIKWLKTTNSGYAVIKCENGQDTKKFEQEIKSKLENGYEVELSKMRLPRIKIVSFQQEMSKEVIEDCLVKQSNILGN